jgi:MoaA/NifB/PqqE/SkfB family radical SAM enzyme
MDFDKLQAVAETIFPFAITVELNSQGDPLLYPHIESVLELIRRNKCELKVQTNGTLFTDRVIELMRRQVGEVNLSLDAVGPKFDEVRRGGVWSKAEPGLKRFLAARNRAKLFVGLYPTVTRRTLGEGIRILDWAAEHRVDAVIFHCYSPIQNSFEEKPTESELATMQEQLREWTGRNGDGVKVQFEAVSLNHRPTRSRKRVLASPEKYSAMKLYAPACSFPVDEGSSAAHPEFSCTAPLSYVEIGLDGQMSVCCRSQNVSLGDATSVETFADAWFGQAYSDIRASLRRDATGPYPLANCDGCMRFFAPIAAEKRLAATQNDSSGKTKSCGLSLVS